MKKWFAKIAKAFVILAALVGLAFAIPFVERIPGPSEAVIKEQPASVKFRLAVAWYDRGLNAEYFSRELDFDPQGQASLPAFEIPTNLGRVMIKRLLTPLGAWSACEHCYGPTTSCSLFLQSAFTPPDKMRLAQNQVNGPDSIIFSISLIPDEKKFSPRQMGKFNASALLAEARNVIGEHDEPYIAPARYGPELTRINPVRAEVMRGALVLWMGGEEGYAIVPDSESCPGFNRIFVGGTEEKGIFTLRAMH